MRRQTLENLVMAEEFKEQRKRGMNDGSVRSKHVRSKLRSTIYEITVISAPANSVSNEN